MKKTLVSLMLLAGSAYTATAQTLADARQHLYYERYASAEQSFHQLLQQNTNDAAAWQGLTEAYLLQNKVQQAADSLQKAPPALYNEPYLQAARGAVLLEQGRNSEAAPLFDAALNQTRYKDAALLAAVSRAHIQAKSGDAGTAIEWAKKAIKREKNDAALYVLLGDAYRKMHNGSEAYKAYREALAKNDKYAAAYHRIGEIFLTQKNAELYLENFQYAIAADAAYAPSLYQLYRHQFYHDPVKAMEYYRQYLAHTDASLQTRYELTDLLYLTKDYDKAIAQANELVAQEATAQPRLYKLIGYSYAAKNDSAKALELMQQYFAKAPDSIVIAKDYETMSLLHQSAGNDSLSTIYLAKAADTEKDTVLVLTYYRQLANQAKAKNDYAEQARWLQRYYTENEKANNLDLYYWALAHFRSGDYAKADTVFGMYVDKYPEQSFGYYWQARSQSLLDKEMEQGLAVPTYQKLIDVLQKDTTDTNYKKWMVEAYAYLAAYEANTQKDFAEAKGYFEKVLEVDPENESAKKYIAVLEAQLDKK